jgi:hypothetical protein
MVPLPSHPRDWQQCKGCDHCLPPKEAERAKQKDQAQLEWELEFVWHRELDPIKQQIDAFQKDSKQKV